MQFTFNIRMDVLGCAAALPPELGSRPMQEACQCHKCLELHDISALQEACQRHFKRLGMVYACANAREFFFLKVIFFLDLFFCFLYSVFS